MRKTKPSGEPGDIKVPFGRRLKELRERAGLAQADLARASNISRVYYGTVERGEKGASIETIQKLAAGLSLPAYELLRFDAPGAESDLADKLGRKITSLARGSAATKIERFERIAKTYFEPDAPAPSQKKRRRR